MAKAGVVLGIIGTVLLVLALVLVLASGVQRRPQGLVVATALQVPLLLTGLINGVMWFVAGVFVLATAHAWSRTGRRYRTDEVERPAAASGSRPHDAAGSRAIDDWDDLSRGEDPTA